MQHLHSTMVLLKFTKITGENSTDFNLHSTMVLLKSLVVNGYGAKQDKSTFHYGSIKIFT